MEKKVNLHPSLKILVVDDMSSIRDLAISVLNEFGFKNIKEAKDGNEAWNLMIIESACNDPFELIISDINMPNCNGLQLLKKVRASGTFKDLPVLMVSTEREVGVIMEAVEEGANNYILKPYTSEMMKEKLISIFYK